MNFHELMEIICNFQRPSSFDLPLHHFAISDHWTVDTVQFQGEIFLFMCSMGRGKSFFVAELEFEFCMKNVLN